MKYLLGFVLALVLTLGLAGCGGGSSAVTDAAPTTTTTPDTTTPTTTPDTTTPTPGNTVSLKPKILIETTQGNITLELDRVAAPITVANIMTYVEEGFYNGTIFHRVIPGFMIQGGGMTTDMKLKITHTAIQNEATNGLKNDRGTIAMARTSAPHTATSQFFINVVDNTFLNYKDQTTSSSWGYAVFGKVIAGMDVVDKIAAVQTSNTVPVEPVIMTKVSEIQ